MSFASGFNSGLNLTASLRASRDRQEALGQNQLRLQVTQRYNDMRAEALEEQMRADREARIREETEKVKSKFLLGEFVSQAKDIPLDSSEGFKRYTDLSADMGSKITDPEVRQRFQYIDKNNRGVAMQSGLQRLQDFENRRFIEEKELQRELLDKGHPLDPHDPNFREHLQEARNYKEAEALLGDDIAWAQTGVTPVGLRLSNEGLVTLKEKIREIGGDREELGSLSPDARQKRGIGKQLDSLDKASPTYLRDALEITRDAPKMSQFEQQSFEEGFTALGLSREAEHAIKDLEVYTGKALGELWAEVTAVFGRDEKTSVYRNALTRLVPSLARGVFNEVGVLTDEDVKRIGRTIGSIDQSKHANIIAIELTRSLIGRGLRNKLKSAIANRVNVSMYADQVNQIESIPAAVYPTRLLAKRQLVKDLQDGFIKPGQTYTYWDDQAKQMITRRAEPIENYIRTGAPNAAK